jgi:hypothetical protein
MKKLVSLITSLVLCIIVKAQDCPTGYEMKNVKCNGTISVKCVPVSYSCHLCWTIEWAKCDGSFNGKGIIGGGANWHESYQACIDDAEQKRNGSLYHNCPNEILDKFNYRIYLDDSKFCNQQGKEVAKGFTQRMIAEIINYRMFLKEQTQLPGTTILEYKSVLDEGESNANTLLNMLNNFESFGFEQVEIAFQNLQLEETKIKQLFSKLELANDDDDETLPMPKPLSTSNDLQQRLKDAESQLNESNANAVSQLRAGSANTIQWANENTNQYSQQSLQVNPKINQGNNSNSTTKGNSNVGSSEGDECPQAKSVCDNETAKVKAKGINATQKEILQAQANCYKAYLRCPNLSSKDKETFQQGLQNLESVISQL